MANKRVQYIEGTKSEVIPAPTAGSQYLRRNSGNTGWELVTISPGATSATLSDILANGNTTDGYDIVLSSGDAIMSADGYVNISGHLSVSNGLDLSNKKITSALDPTAPQDVATKIYVDNHIVQLTSISPVNVDKSAAVVGTATTAARADHKHNILTAIAGPIGSGNTEGTANTLARSDHTHAVKDLNFDFQTQGAVLYFDGTNWVVLSPGTDGYILTTHSSGQNPTWAPIPDLSPVIITRPLNNIIYVDNTFSGISTGSINKPYSTITAAISAATTGTHIILTPGIYSETLSIPSNKNLKISSISYTSLVECSIIGEITWTFKDGSELDIDGINLTSGMLLKDGDAGVGKVQLRITNSTYGDIVNGNFSAAPYTHDIDIDIIGQGFSANGQTNGDLINVSGNVSVNNCILSGSITCSKFYGDQVYFGNSITVSAKNYTIVTNSEFGSGVIFNFTNFGGVFNVDVTSNYFAVNSAVSLTGAGATKVILSTDALPDGYSVGQTLIWDGYVWLPGSVMGNTTPINVDKSTANAGISITAARSDHKHNVSTASAVSVGAANAEGTAISLARSDHTHAVTNLSIASQAKGDLLQFDGTSWTRLAAGLDGYVLTTHGTSANPTWVSKFDNSAVTGVADWYVDASTGNDNNDGKSSITAFATTDRLSQVLCPNGAKWIVQQNTAIHIAAGTYNALELNVSFPVGSNFTLDIFGAYTSSAPITLSSVVNTVQTISPVRGRITTASGTFVDKLRIRSTSGASVGAVTYCTGLNSATDGYVKSWVLENASLANAPANVNIANGTTCVVDTLTVSIARVQIKTSGTPFGGSIHFHDTILANGCDWENFITGSANCVMSQCEIGGGTGTTRSSGNIQYRNCRFSAAIIGWFGLSTPVVYGSVFEGFNQVFNVSMQFIGGANCFNGGSAMVGSTQQSARGSGLSIDAVEWVNGISGAAITCCIGGELQIIGQQYGFGNPYSIGVQLFSGAHAVINAASNLNIVATQPMVIAGNNLPYSAIPINYPNSDCSIVLTTDANSTANLALVGQSKGDVLYFDGTDWVRLPASTDGYVLTTHSTGQNPTWTSTASAGGLHTVINNAARDAYPTPLRQEGMIIYSENTQCYYELQADLTTWSFYDANPALSSQSVWYVDPAGNNNNDGKTPSTAIADLIELGNRLSPHGKLCCLTNDVTVNVNSISLTPVSYGELFINVGVGERLIGDVAIYTLNIICAITSSSPIVLSSYTTPSGASAIRGQMVTASGTFVNQERIRVTSGPALGGVCYSTGLNGDAQHTFVSALSIPTISGILANGGHGAILIPVPGDTVVVDTLTVSINRVAINCSTPFAQVFIQDAKIVGAYISGVTRSVFGGSGGSVLFSGCWQSSSSGAWFCTSGGAFLLSCRTPASGKTSLIGEGWCIVEHAIQGTLGLDGEAISYGLTIDGGQLRVGINSDNNHPGQARFSKLVVFTSFTNTATGGGIEFENGSSRSGSTIFNSGAIIVCSDSELNVTDFNTYLWGGSSLFDFGIVIMSNAYALQGNISIGVFSSIWKIPSTVNIVLNNLYFAFSDNPVLLKNSNCGLIGGNYNVANNYSETDAGFYLTNQSANIAATNFFQIKKAGLYKVCGYVATTTADTSAIGNPTLNVIFTDDSGVVRTIPVATAPMLTALGGNGGEVIIECGSSLALAAWSITGVGSAGSSKFSIRMRVEKDCYGA